MCHFVSWIGCKGKIYYLNDDRLADSRGRELQKYETDPEEWRGHGSILWYYGLEGLQTVHHECEDFSDPSMFPAEIVGDIKAGKFRLFGVATGVLTTSAWAEYGTVEKSAWAEYKKVRKLALAEYEKVRKPALAGHKKVLRMTFWDLVSNLENRITAWK